MTITTYLAIQPLVRLFQRGVWLCHTRGKGRFLYSVLRRFVSLSGFRCCLHLYAVDLWRLRLPDSCPASTCLRLFEVRLARPSDLPELSRYFGNRKRVETRLARGDRCIIAAGRDSIGAAVWLAIGPDQSTEDWNELRCAFQVPAGVAWSYDGKGTKIGAWGTLMKQVPGFLRRENIHEIATIIGGNNWQSMDAHRSLGYQPLGMLLHARILGLPLHLFKPAGGNWWLLPKKIGSVNILTSHD